MNMIEYKSLGESVYFKNLILLAKLYSKNTVPALLLPK